MLHSMPGARAVFMASFFGPARVSTIVGHDERALPGPDKQHEGMRRNV